MKRVAVTCFSLCLMMVSHPHAMAADQESLVRSVEKHAGRGDDLGVRILVKSIRTSALSYEEWKRVRAALHERPGAGWDLLQAWDRVRRAGAPSALDKELAAADRLMLQRNFEQAFNRYQSIAQNIKRGMTDDQPQNKQLYFSVLHSMGLALYGSGRFTEADQVLKWIPQIYPSFREVLFERMWAGFRGDRIDLALGAVASQYTSYFSSFVDPETYLVQIYIYRKLCRNADLELARESAKRFYANLKNGTFSMRDWARAEIDTMVLMDLVEKEHDRTSSEVSKEARETERRRIEASLIRRFKEDRAKLLNKMQKVTAYVNLALSTTAKEMPPIRSLPSTSELIRKGLEMWPVEDAEDWIDELGRHVFAGGSQCQDQP